MQAQERVTATSDAQGFAIPLFFPFFAPPGSLWRNSCHSTAIPTLPRCGAVLQLARWRCHPRHDNLGIAGDLTATVLADRQSRAPVSSLSHSRVRDTAGRISATPKNPICRRHKILSTPKPVACVFHPRGHACKPHIHPLAPSSSSTCYCLRHFLHFCFPCLSFSFSFSCCLLASSLVRMILGARGAGVS